VSTDNTSKLRLRQQAIGIGCALFGIGFASIALAQVSF
jgi:hypothetical protein